MPRIQRCLRGRHAGNGAKRSAGAGAQVEGLGEFEGGDPPLSRYGG